MPDLNTIFSDILEIINKDSPHYEYFMSTKPFKKPNEAKACVDHLNKVFPQSVSVKQQVRKFYVVISISAIHAKMQEVSRYRKFVNKTNTGVEWVWRIDGVKDGIVPYTHLMSTVKKEIVAKAVCKNLKNLGIHHAEIKRTFGGFCIMFNTEQLRKLLDVLAVVSDQKSKRNDAKAAASTATAAQGTAPKNAGATAAAGGPAGIAIPVTETTRYKLLKACECKDEPDDEFRRLVQQACDEKVIHLTNSYGMNPLHFVAKNGNIGRAEVLISACKTLKQQRDNIKQNIPEGRTPYDVANEKGHTDPKFLAMLNPNPQPVAAASTAAGAAAPPLAKLM